MSDIPFEDKLLNSKLENLIQFPELIHDIGPWRSMSLCFYCLNEIKHGSTCLFLQHFDAIGNIKCPTCWKTGDVFSITRKSGNTYSSDWKYISNPLKHYIVRKREITVGYTKSWFKSTPITITETKLIESHVDFPKPTSDNFKYIPIV